MTKGRLFWRQTSGIGPPALRPPLDVAGAEFDLADLDQVGRLAPDLSLFHLRTPSWWPQLMQRAASLNPFFLMKHGARFRNISLPHFGQDVAWSARPRDRAASSLASA